MSDGIDLRERYDLVVVGAGPAGMAAASSSAGLGLSTIILDEQPSPGGQIYRAVTESPLRGDRRASALGASYWRGSDLARGLTASGATHVANATVWSVSRDADDGVREIAVSLNGRSRMLRAPAVILATGAQERPVPIPGWTLPGVMTAGAAQILLKTSALVPAGRAVLAGSGQLHWMLAAQLSRIGAAPATILDTTPPARASLWRVALAFAASPYIGEGLALMREVRAHIRPIRATALAVEGDAKVEAVRYRDASGVERRVEADTVLLHLGVVPNTNLARSIGCAHAWNDDNACFDAEVDPWGATSRPGIWVAGDG
ncbi:MAG: FAD-dependent oxidoreductase, partial [Rhodospirillales bacterium]|nr:FAD-dependent oxidoreductase [Rhodospirillales bacterium]